MKRLQVINNLMDHGICTIPLNITEKELPRVNAHIQGASLHFHSSTNADLITLYQSTFSETITIEDD